MERDLARRQRPNAGEVLAIRIKGTIWSDKHPA